MQSVVAEKGVTHYKSIIVFVCVTKNGNTATIFQCKVQHLSSHLHCCYSVYPDPYFFPFFFFFCCCCFNLVCSSFDFSMELRCITFDFHRLQGPKRGGLQLVVEIFIRKTVKASPYIKCSANSIL